MVLLLTELSGLPGIDVESYEENKDGLILEVAAHSDSVNCPRCGTVSRHLHQNHGYLVRDLPISRHRKTWLRVNRRQFKCSSCVKPFSETFEFVGARRVYTDRYAEVVGELIHSDTANVSRQHGLSEDIVWSMVEYINEKKSVST